MPTEKDCKGRCSGCALKIDAKAHTEVDNRMVAMVAAIGGRPFFCHDALGWTPDKEGYPDSAHRPARAIGNLMSAPKLIHDCPSLALSDATASGMNPEAFAGDRAYVGRTPVCGGWKRAVKKLHALGWFSDPLRRKWARHVAGEAITMMDELKAEKNPRVRKLLIRDIGEMVQVLGDELKRVLGKKPNLEEA